MDKLYLGCKVCNYKKGSYYGITIQEVEVMEQSLKTFKLGKNESYLLTIRKEEVNKISSRCNINDKFTFCTTRKKTKELLTEIYQTKLEEEKNKIKEIEGYISQIQSL